MHQSFSKNNLFRNLNIPSHIITSPLLMKVGFSQTMFWSWGMRYLGGIELARLNSVNFESLLDIGCGDGRFLREVARRLPDVQLSSLTTHVRLLQLAKAFNSELEYSCLDTSQKSLITNLM